MKYLKCLVFLFLFVFLAGCTGTIPTAGYPPNSNQTSTSDPYFTPPSRDDDEYNRRIREDDDRDEVLRRRSGGDACEDEDNDHDCKDQCRDMYRRTDDREDCEELDAEEIEKLFEVHQALEDADDNDLRDIDLEDLEAYLNVSIAGFDGLIRNYGTNEAEEVLLWIAQNEDVAETFEDEDDDFKTLEQLLKVLSSFSSSELERPFTRDIDRRTLFEEAIDARNDTAVDWFLNYIFYTDSDCNNDEEVSPECFTVICEIGDGFQDEDFLRDWLVISSFEDYIDDIIEGGVNAGVDPKWDATAIENPDDLYEDRDNTWVSTLCGGLI